MPGSNYSESEKDNWIKERACVIFYSQGGGNDSTFLVAEMRARREWNEQYGDPQKQLF